MTAFGYVRKSVMPDPTKTLSPQVQRSRIEALARAHGDDELVFLEDLDISGTKVAGRPGYLRLVEALEEGEARAVYAYDLSRLHRNTREALRFFQIAREHKVVVRMVEGNIDTSDATGELVLTVLAGMNTWQARTTSEKMKATFALKKERGDPIGSPGYGMRPGEDAEAVLQAFREAGSYNGAAALLNARKVPTRFSKKVCRDTGVKGCWWPSTVGQMMRRIDPSFRGRVAKGVAAGGLDFILARLLRCPTCGTLLSGQRYRGSTKYSCKLGNAGMPHPRVTAPEHRILDVVKAEIAHLRVPEEWVKIEEEGNAERQRLDAQRMAVLDLYQGGDITKEEKDQRLARVAAAQAKVEGKSRLYRLPEIDWTASPKLLNRVMRTLFGSIDLDPVTFRPVSFDWLIPEWRVD